MRCILFYFIFAPEPEILPRDYPIVYWFKVYHNKNTKKGRPVYSSLVPSLFYKKPGSITIAELMP
ncbi:hypothetical protein COE80_02585 [Bacillus pseudomycoides]|nr:hypothetical protein COE80_02585 [Bacillus pseudomycoides]